jgi:DNA-binding CsgD family transcriptional regulator
MSKKDQILKLLKEGKAIGEVAKALKVKPGYVYYIRWMNQKTPGVKTVRKARKKASRLMQEVVRTHKAVNAAVQREKELAPMRARDAGLTKGNRKALELLQNNLVRGIDVVNNPPHYKTGGIDTLDFIEAKDLNFRLANVVKYVVRCGKKINSDPVQDLEKARFYLEREIEARRSA